MRHRRLGPILSAPAPGDRAALLDRIEQETDRLLENGEPEQALAHIREFRAEVADDPRLAYEEALVLRHLAPTRDTRPHFAHMTATDSVVAISVPMATIKEALSAYFEWAFWRKVFGISLTPDDRLRVLAAARVQPELGRRDVRRGTHPERARGPFAVQ